MDACTARLSAGLLGCLIPKLHRSAWELSPLIDGTGKIQMPLYESALNEVLACKKMCLRPPALTAAAPANRSAA